MCRREAPPPESRPSGIAVLPHRAAGVAKPVAKLLLAGRDTTWNNALTLPEKLANAILERFLGVAKFHQKWPQFDQSWPILSHGRIRPALVRCGPTVSLWRPILAEFASARESLAKIPPRAFFGHSKSIFRDPSRAPSGGEEFGEHGSRLSRLNSSEGREPGWLVVFSATQSQGLLHFDCAARTPTSTAS